MQRAQTNPTQADFLTVAQAAEFLGVSPWTLRNWDNSGKLKSLRHPLNGYRMYREEDLRTILANGHLLGKRRATLAPNVDWGQLGPSEHIVQFYETEAYLVESVSDFLAKGLFAGEGVIMIATGDHRKRIEKNLGARGIDLQAASERGQYAAFHAAESLDRLMAGRSPDPQRFHEFIGVAVGELAEKWPRVRAFGEMVALLCEQGNRDAAAELEALWNDLGKRHSFALLCAYPLSGFSDGADASALDHVCASHTRVIPAESYASLASSDEQLRAITVLQQKAKALEAEIAQRSEAERELFDFVENAVEGLHKVGPDGRIIWANKAELDLLGYPPDEYIGHRITEFHVDPEAAEDTLARLARGETLRDHPARLRCKDGSIRDVLINSNARFENGAFLYSRCFTRDVTSLKQAQEAQALLAAVVESSDDAIVSKSLDGVIRSWNAGAKRIFGYTAAEAVGQPITLIIPPELHEEERSILARLRHGERIEHFETTRVAKDGRRLSLSLTISPVRDAGGHVVGASKIGRDITARKQAEERLRQSEERYRRLAELLPVGIYTCDAPSGAITYFNKQAVELWGRAPALGERADRFCGSNRMFLPTGAPLAHEQCPMAVAVREGREFRNHEVVIERPDGSRVTALVNIDPIRDADGHIVGAVNVFHDVMALKQAKEALREQKENLQTLLDTLPVAVLIAEDRECRRISGNPAAASLLRLPPGANLSKTAPPGEVPSHFRVFKDGDEVSGEALPIQRAAKGEVVRDDAVDLVFSDGAVCHALISAQPLLDEAGKPRGAVACILDVTEIKNAELALRDADRRKDEFLATLAHELRNPLAPIRNGLHILQLTKGAGQEVERVHEMLDRQVAHMVRLVDDLLELSRISRGKIELRREPIALATVIAHAVETSKPLIEAAGHHLNVSLPGESVAIDGDAVRLSQVFSNLLNNAAKYTDRGGRITVLCTSDGEAAVVSVRDTGIGIPPDMLSRVFEIFAQVPNPLRRTEQGLGIGLSLVRALVTMHGGRVEVYSDGIGQGSEFVVRLPVCGPELDASIQCASLAGAGT